MMTNETGDRAAPSASSGIPDEDLTDTGEKSG